MLLATGLAAGFVFYDLGWRSIWIDEATTWATASQHGSGLWFWLLHDGGNMLGYYTAMHLLIAIIGTSPFALRLVSALAYTATVPCGYFLLRRLFDWKAATAGAFLLAASSPVVFIGQQARGYTPAILFTTAAAWALSVAVLDRSVRAWIGFVACATAAAYMTLLAALAVLALLSALLAVRRSELEIRRVATSVAVLSALWAPLAVAAIRRGSGQLDWIQPLSWHGGQYSYQELTWQLTSSPRSAVLGIATCAGCALGATLLAWRLKRHGRSAPEVFGPALLVAWLAVPIITLVLISAVMTPVLSDRYVLPEIPAAGLLLGAVVTRIRPAPVGLALVAAVVVSRGLQVADTYGSQIENWDTTVNYVVAHHQQHDCAAFFVADGFTAFDYYYLRLPSLLRTLVDPVLPATSWESKNPYVLDPETFPPGTMTRIERACPRLWVVYTHTTTEAPGPGVPKYFAFKYLQLNHFRSQLETGGFRLRKTRYFVAVTVSLYVHPLPASP